MGVSKADAFAIFQKFFRGPVLKAGSRKYSFLIQDLSESSVSDLHRDLFRGGSDITRKEILSFIDQDSDESPVPFLHLPLRYVVPGEVMQILQCADNSIYENLYAIKMSDTHYLTWCGSSDSRHDNVDGGIIRLNEDSVIAEQQKSPFKEDSTVLSIYILPPTLFYRYVDSYLLDERYAESSPDSALPLYSMLLESHVRDTVNRDWPQIIDKASSLGLSTHTVFKILEYLTKTGSR